jgi:hypothetical protein
MIIGGHEEFRISKSERRMTYPLDFVVHSFKGFIKDPELEC